MDAKLGCFGSVLYHAPKTQRCQSCALFEACKAESESNKVKLRDWYAKLRTQADESQKSRKVGARGMQAVAAPEAAPRARDTVVATTPLVATEKKMAKKPKQFVDKWCKQGVKFEDYKSGVNPFASCGNKFAVVAMDFFMQASDGRVEKIQLVNEFIEKLEWLGGSAASHANIVFDAFEYLGIIVVHGNTAYLRT